MPERVPPRTLIALAVPLIVASFVCGILLFVLGGGAALARRLLAIGLYALASALVGVVTIDPLIGALSGHF